MKDYHDYDKNYPELIVDIIKYFDISHGIDNERTILNFCIATGIQKENSIQYKYNPNVVNRICQKLCRKNQMFVLQRDGGLGLENRYATIIHDEEIINKKSIQIYFNSLVYGFEYIYNLYKDIVVPLVWEKENGDPSLGTGFKIWGGIATARHCIEDPKTLSIKGYSVEELVNSKIYVSDNPNLDIAFIDVGRKEEISALADDGKVLQDVLTLGYPKIPTFTDFLTAEKATISSKADVRLTPTKGSITAFGTDYFAKTELMLITAKICGGNSGGPVINEEGSVVGISCRIPNYEGDIGDYDNLGYGIVVPIKYLSEIIEKKTKISVSPNFFREYNS